MIVKGEEIHYLAILNSDQIDLNLDGLLLLFSHFWDQPKASSLFAWLVADGWC
jgi:hypothetical protein